MYKMLLRVIALLAGQPALATKDVRQIDVGLQSISLAVPVSAVLIFTEH